MIPTKYFGQIFLFRSHNSLRQYLHLLINLLSHAKYFYEMNEMWCLSYVSLVGQLAKTLSFGDQDVSIV